MNSVETLERQPKGRLLALGFGAVAGVGLIDWLTGPEISFSIFYLLPISAVAWTAGRTAGTVVAVMSAIAWLAADLLAGHLYSNPVIPFWNAAMRLGIFSIVTYALSTLRVSEEKREELTQFVVHDLRAPLASAKGGLQLLAEAAAATMDRTQQDLVAMCLTSFDRLLILINSLLDLARLERGQMPLQKAAVGVNALVKLSLEQMAAWARQRHVTLAVQLDADVSTVHADHELTLRVLVNLLSNAIKYSPPESAVTVRVTCRGDNGLAFSVADQGPGIPSEWTDRVFGKFAQVEARKAGAAVGSGLGLAFCKLAIEAQGGAHLAGKYGRAWHSRNLYAANRPGRLGPSVSSATWQGQRSRKGRRFAGGHRNIGRSRHAGLGRQC